MTHAPTAPLSDLLPILQRELENCRAHDNANATLVLSREMLERLVEALGSDAVSQEARFLLDRLDEVDFSLPHNEFARDWNGHVAPSIYRIRSLLDRGE